ncbi:hypothetical protein K490DRAFT_50404 [Saccharata proteae CBS 121410]|uniref:Sister chromatid cohesion protein-like protein Dcc1 n=1 Tax=Saccharata proteae CBS 121410 TaxID=1314787 RepID=A0A9P4HQ46_9PEZI|nr:hypothetical protein K490DRAFT_50404 [Saccharata proteae CBS 121410]
MATQDLSGVPFASANEQQNFRLMELPEPLLELLSSPEPPTLAIKSLPPPKQSNVAQAQNSAHAVLCTPGKTYHLRQVQTSNSVLLAEPTEIQENPDAIPVTAISAIASCGHMLELHPVSDSPLPLLRNAVPLFESPAQARVETWPRRGAAEVFADIPFSDEECQRACVELAAFELEGAMVRPSDEALLANWRGLISAATAEGINLASQFQMQDLLRMMEEDETCCAPLVQATLRLLSLDEEAGADVWEWATVNRSKSIMWVGCMLLRVRSSAGPLMTATFLDEWKDALPEAWRDDVDLVTIKDEYILPTSTTIVHKSNAASLPSIPTGAAPAAAPAKGPRKWHDKFKATRRESGSQR